MFKNRIREIRHQYNLSQTDLGKILSMSQRAISRLESGETSPNEYILNTLADYFGVSTDYLLCRTELKTYSIKHIKKHKKNDYL